MSLVALSALANQVPSKTRDAGTDNFLGSALNLSKSFTLAALIVYSHKPPVEKQRDMVSRMILLRTVAPFCLSDKTLAFILDADPDEQNALLGGLARNSQQSLVKYQLFGTVANFMAEKVLTQHDVFPSNKKHLGLIGDHASKKFMDA